MAAGLFGAEDGRWVGYVDVAVERGVDASPTGLTYGVSAELWPMGVGQRVVVPLGRGNKPATGYVVRVVGAASGASSGPSAAPQGSASSQGDRGRSVGRKEIPDASPPEGGSASASGEPDFLRGLDPKKLKGVLRVDGAGLSLPAELVDLARWVAAYYACPLGMVFGSIVPAAVTRGTGMAERWEVRIPAPGRGEGEGGVPDASSLRSSASAWGGGSGGVTKLQGAVLEAAGEQWRDAKEVLLAAGAKTTGPVKKLVEAGLLESRRVRVVRSELDLEAQQLAAEGGPPELSEEQSAALERLVPGLGRFGVHLLHGVTGSGKTEVYLRLIAALRERDDLPGGVIVLVPEIALTPQAVGRFYARFGGQPVRVLHSGLTAAQRHAQWRAILADEAPIVIGARSAVFAPVRNLGLIIVDEEHEGSYKQDQLPRYHARDVAVVRARRAPGSCSVGLEASGGRSGPSAAPQGSASGGSGGGVPVVLGSATPSLESYANAVGVGGVPDASSLRSSASASGERPKVEPAAGWHYLRLAKRVPGMRLPEVELVDLAQERRERKGVHLLGRLMEQRLTQCFDSDRQALLLLNRRGFANYIACPDHGCGWMLSCDHCDATMVYHKDARLPTGGVVRCHHCTAERVLPEVCPMSGHRVVTFGLGTQRVEEELGRKFPDARVVRMDSDAMRMGRDFAATLRAFGRREIDVLLGTQMIAKGLDFPGVGLVGVVWADTALNLPDFRSAERTFQLIAQVAGRSGRSERAGRVVVQTFNPDDPAVRLAAEHDYDRFAPRELALRAAAGLPPVWRMARVVLRDPDQIKSVRRARESADLLGGLNKQQGGEVRIVGPSPPALSRVADHFRQQILLLSPPPRAAGRLQDLLTAARNAGLVSDDRTAVDVDPLALL